MTNNCSLKAYYKEFTTEYDRCLSNPMAAALDGGAACVMKAVVKTLGVMQARCATRADGTECTPKGYIEAIVSKIDHSEKKGEVQLIKIEQNAQKQLFKVKGYLPPPDDVQAVKFAAGGCIVGGTIGGVVGAAATPELFFFGAVPGAVGGCRVGAQIGTGLHRAYTIAVKVGAFFEDLDTGYRAAIEHSRACEAKSLPIEMRIKMSPQALEALPPEIKVQRIDLTKVPVPIKQSFVSPQANQRTTETVHPKPSQDHQPVSGAEMTWIDVEDLASPNNQTTTHHAGIGSTIVKKVNDTINQFGSILPSETKVGGTVNLSHLKKTVVIIQHPIGEDFSAGSNIVPSNPKSSTLTASVNVSSPNESNPHTPTTSLGLNLNPSNIEASTISVTAGNSGYSGGILINPSKPKETQFQVSVPFEDISVGATVNMSKPLQAHVHAEVPATVYGVTFLVGVDVPLRKPKESTVSLSFPVPGMNIYLGSVGPKKAQRDLKRSLHPDKEFKHITNKGKHAAQKTWGKVKGFFRGKHKHKHREEWSNIHVIPRASKFLRRPLGSFIQKESLAYAEAVTQLIKIAQQNKILLENNIQIVQQTIANVRQNKISVENNIQTVQQTIATVRENDITLQQISEGFEESGEIVQGMNSTIQPIVQRMDQAPSLIETNRRLEECNSRVISPLNTDTNIRKLSTKISPEAAARLWKLGNTKKL